MECLWICLLYIFEIANYVLTGVLFDFGKNIRRNILKVGSCLFAFAEIVLFLNQIFLPAVVIRGYVLVLFFMCLPTGRENRLFGTVISFFLVNCVEGSIESLLELGNIAYEDYFINRCLESSITFILFIFGYRLKRNIFGDRQSGKHDWFQRCLFLFSVLFAMETSATVSLLRFASDYVEKPGFRQTAKLLSFFASIGVGCLGILLVQVKKNNEKLKRMIHIEKNAMQMQKNYYELLLEREQDTKKYRHDMTNHLLCMRGYAKNEDWNTLSGYIAELMSEIQDFGKEIHHTGNSTLDMLINYYTGLLPEITEIRVNGMINVEADEMLLCTVFGNLLRNAAEELMLCKEEAYLRIHLIQGDEYVRISIQNSKRERTVKNGNHYGFGLKNAVRGVEEMSGQIDVTEDETSYLVIVTLPV